MPTDAASQVMCRQPDNCRLDRPSAQGFASRLQQAHRRRDRKVEQGNPVGQYQTRLIGAEGATTLDAITRALNDQGVRSARGCRWHVSSQANLISRIENFA
jgi:hypothetical protein